MNILIPNSWLREYLDTKATPTQIKECLSLCGPSVERVGEIKGDCVYDVEITTNRIDMASVYGIAREAAAILPRFKIAASLKTLTVKDPPQPSTPVKMDISDPEKICNRILGIVIDIDPGKPSPDYIRERLERSGVRSLNNLVDITNYVMLEVGHPCHVFDYDRVKTYTFLIRKAKKNEPLVTLDGKKYLLSDEDVIIDDGTGRVIDLPGIMGTENSVVTESTKRIIFFIESNNPTLIRKTSMRYGIRTMAASINEKHPDPELSKIALLRGIELYQKIAGGKVVGNFIDIYPHKTSPQKISVSVSFINERLGIELPTPEIIKILHSLQFDVNNNSKGALEITPPTFRQFDVIIPEDIVEEVARIYGYHNLPTNLMTGSIPITEKSKDLPIESRIKTLLKDWGLTETYHYSFTSKALIEKAELPLSSHLPVANPLTEETAYMRTSLIPAMLETISTNQPLKENLSLFELSNIYIPKKNDLPDEISTLVIAQDRDFLHLKGIVEQIFAEFNLSEIKLTEGAAHFWHPAMSTTYTYKGKPIARLGRIHPKFESVFKIRRPTFLAEILVSEIVEHAVSTKSYIPISPYPQVNEDLTFIIPDIIRVGDVISVIRETSPLIRNVQYSGRFQKNVTFKITYHDEKQNLENSEIQLIREKIFAALKEKLNVLLKLT